MPGDWLCFSVNSMVDIWILLKDIAEALAICYQTHLQTHSFSSSDSELVVASE